MMMKPSAVLFLISAEQGGRGTYYGCSSWEIKRCYSQLSCWPSAASSDYLPLLNIGNLSLPSNTDMQSIPSPLISVINKTVRSFPRSSLLLYTDIKKTVCICFQWLFHFSWSHSSQFCNRMFIRGFITIIFDNWSVVESKLWSMKEISYMNPTFKN